MASFQGKVFAVTGAGSGIGRATAELLASRGAILSLADVNGEGLQQTLKKLSGNNHSTTIVDVSDSKRVTSWIEDTVQKHGQLDGAANIAGIVVPPVPLKDTRDEDFKKTMDVNAFGVFYCLRAQLNNIVPKGGSIVNLASVVGLMGTPGSAAYVASKHAVVGLTKTAAREVPHVRVNAVAPGPVATPMVAELERLMNTPLPTNAQCIDRQGTATEIANVVAFLLSDEASFITGTTYTVDGGWMA